MRPQIVKKIALVLCFLASASMLGQSASGSSGPPPPNRGPVPPELPLDTNILILIVLGLLYGSYVLYKKRQAKDNLA